MKMEKMGNRRERKEGERGREEEEMDDGWLFLG